MKRWLLVSGFTGDEVTARSGVTLRRQRPRARAGYARATGRRIIITRATPRIFAPPRSDSPFAPQISGGQLIYALTARPNGYLKRNRRGQYSLQNVPDHYQEYAISAFVVRSLVRQGLLEERRNGYYPVRNRTATYRGEGTRARPTRMRYPDD